MANKKALYSIKYITENGEKMTTVKVKASTNYEIIIGKDILKNAGELIISAVGDCRLCIVTDDTVDSLYSNSFCSSAERCGLNFEKFVIPHGEQSKNSKNLISLLEFMAQKEFTRKDCVVALGGGVVGDLAGFASAVYMRGMRFIQVPTTLLAAVDSSVGGKTAVDLAAGKNLVGAFHQPSLVICDIRTLDTLSDEIFSDGYAEVIKYAIINDREMFERLEALKSKKDDLERVIADCVSHKADIVSRDEFDTGERMLLNLGHTVAHAIEALSHYTVSHGRAVGIGMAVVTRMSHSLGLCSYEDSERIHQLLHRSDLCTECTFSAQDLAKIACADKKRAGDTINLIVPYAIGDTRTMKIKINELASYIEKGLL